MTNKKVKYVHKGESKKISFLSDIGLTLGKEYIITKCVIHSSSTTVYLINDEGKEQGYNSVLFDYNFERRLKRAINYFDEKGCPSGSIHGIFEKDYF